MNNQPRKCIKCQEELKVTVNEWWHQGKTYCPFCYYEKIEKPKLRTWLNKQPNISHE